MMPLMRRWYVAAAFGKPLRHANVAVGWTSAAPRAGGPGTLQGGDSVEPWYVDADAQPAILAWMGSYDG